jgi:4-amino-4-deoxy-L-arabinose transferase-like glycosyltransferase
MISFLPRRMPLGVTGILSLLALALFAFHIMTNNQYGFHRDELAFVDEGRHPDWGYVSYPPLTPALARLSMDWFGASLTGLRVFPALAMSAVLVLAGLMIRELGGSPSTQIAGALAVASSPIALNNGSLLTYVCFDYLWWVLIAYLLIRLLKSEDPRWWPAIGAVIGLGMMTKYTMAFYAAALAGAVLLTKDRRHLASPWLWGGVALSILICLPNLIWQIRHDFISLDFLGSIHARDVAEGRADMFLLEQLVLGNNPFLLPITFAGLYFFLLHADGARYRLLGWLYVLVFLLFLVMRGRGYYLGGVYPMLTTGGAVLCGVRAVPRTTRLGGTGGGHRRCVPRTARRGTCPHRHLCRQLRRSRRD